MAASVDKTPDILREVMKWASAVNPDYQVRIPRSEVFYVRAAIEAKTGRKLHVYEVEDLLKEEGLI